MADETLTPEFTAFDPTAAVVNAAPLSIGGQQQASAVRVTSVLAEGTGYTPDEILAGGYFIVDGKSVNSEGKAVNDKGQRVNSSGKLMTSDEILADQYGQ